MKIIKNNSDFSLNIQDLHDISSGIYRSYSFLVDLKRNANPTVCYFVIQKDKQVDGNYGFLGINGGESDYSGMGTEFFDNGDNRICLRSLVWESSYSNSYNYWQTNFLDTNYLVIAVKIIPSGNDNFYRFINCTHNFWINSIFVKEIFNINNNCLGGSDYGPRYSRIKIQNCNIKYFAIVEHEQTSEEIVKTSQLLMDKFDIH